MRFVFSLVGLSLMLSCRTFDGDRRKSDASRPKIVGGERVSAESQVAKVVVALVRNSDLHTFCSGILISPRVVLTAAHCARRSEIDFHVRLGPSTSSGQKRSVQSVVIHEGYDESLMMRILAPRPVHDLAVIHLKRAYRLTKGQEVSLKLEVDALHEGAEIVLVGFGVDDADAKTGSGTLRQVASLIKDVNEESFEFLFGVQNRGSACVGDSGGPAIMKSADGDWRLVGIASRGTEACDEEGVYTDLFHYGDWLNLQLVK